MVAAGDNRWQSYGCPRREGRWHFSTLWVPRWYASGGFFVPVRLAAEQTMLEPDCWPI